MTPSEELNLRRDDICEAILGEMEIDPGVSIEERRQFIMGYLHLMCAAAEGNNAPRDDYLATVIPAIKQIKMPLDYIVGTLVLIDMILVRIISGENRAWVSSFCVDYSKRMIQTWERA